MFITIKKMAILLMTLTAVSFSTRAEIISFDNINIIPMDEERILFNHRVIVDDDRIVAIEPVATPPTIKADRIINGHGKYMLPGLVDTHYHQRTTDTREYDLHYKLLLANGITRVVSMGEDKGQDTIAIREHANRKEIVVPFYVTTGPYIHARHLKNAEDAIKIVRYHKERGYDFIKVHDNFSPDAYVALLDEAEKANIPVIGHAQRRLPLEYSLRLTHIAHIEDIVMNFSDDKQFIITDISKRQAQKIAAQVKDSGIYVSPTLSILTLIQDYTDDTRFEKLKQRQENRYLSKRVYKQYTTPGLEYRRDVFLTEKNLKEMDTLIKSTKTLTRAFYKAGIPLLVGSDNFGFNITGFSFHDEMEAMNSLGIPAYDVLNAATVMSARYLKQSASTGTISIGKKAEFVLLAKNPLDNIEHTRDVQGVMLKGKWLDKQTLDQFLKEVAEAYK